MHPSEPKKENKEEDKEVENPVQPLYGEPDENEYDDPIDWAHGV